MAVAVPTILLNDTRVDQHHGCTRVMEAIDGLLTTNGCHVVARAPAHGDWESHPDVVANAGATRLVVVNGEGTIHHDRPAGARLLRAGMWARERGIPAVLMNAGWEANGPEAVAALQYFALVSVRDSGSASEIRRLGGNCRVVPDLSMYSEWTSPNAARHGMAFTDNVDRAATLRLDVARRAMRANWLPIQAAEPGAVEHLHFLRGGLARSDLLHPSIAWGMMWARMSLSRARLANPKQYLQRLSRLQLLVTGRFHACTLAMLARTPFVAVPSNTSKIQSLVRDAGLAEWRAAAELSAAALVDAMRVGWEPGELAALEDFLVSARAATEGLIRDIKELA